MVNLYPFTTLFFRRIGALYIRWLYKFVDSASAVLRFDKKRGMDEDSWILFSMQNEKKSRAKVYSRERHSFT